MRWIAFLLAGTAWASDTVLPELVPPDTKLVIGVQLRRILDSPFGKSVSAEAGPLAGAKFGGVDPLKDIDRVFLASSGADQKSPSLIVLTGRFHAQPGTSYHGVTVSAVPGHDDQVFAILDGATALAGDAGLVHAAIDRRGKGASAPSQLLARLEAVSARYDFWGIGEHLPPGGQNGQMDSVDGFSFGAALRQGLDLSGEVHLRSAADVAKMTPTLKMVEAMIQSPSSATKFHFESQDGTLKVTLQVPEAELKKGLEAQKTFLASAIAGQMRTIKPQPAERPRAEAKIVTDAQGNTLSITLPGARN